MASGGAISVVNSLWFFTMPHCERTQILSVCLMQDGRQCKMADNARWPLMQDGQQCKMADNARWPLMQDGRQCKMADNARWLIIPDIILRQYILVIIVSENFLFDPTTSNFHIF